MEGKSTQPKRRKGKCGCKKKYVPPEFTNPWPYADNLQVLSETMKLEKNDLSELICRNEYIIKSNQDMEPDSKDELY